jgi:putative chitinase
MADLITGAQLKLIVPNMTQQRADAIADRISFIAPGYGIKTHDVLREVLANICHESGGFRIMQEGMNYKAARIVEVWPSRFVLGKDPTGKKKNANDYAGNPKKLANEVYNGRMGNRIGTDDGYNNRGSGFLQTTGLEAATAYAAWWSNPDVVDIMNRVRTEDWWAVDCAFWEYAVALKLIPASIGDERFSYIVKKINGGYIGLPEREAFFKRCQLYLK